MEGGVILGVELGAWSRAESILAQQEPGKHPSSPILPWRSLRIRAQTLTQCFGLCAADPPHTPLLILPLAAVLWVTPFSFDPKFIGVIRSAIFRVLCDRLYVGRVLGCAVCAYVCVFGMCVSYICVCCVYVHGCVWDVCMLYVIWDVCIAYVVYLWGVCVCL